MDITVPKEEKAVFEPLILENCLKPYSDNRISRQNSRHRPTNLISSPHVPKESGPGGARADADAAEKHK